MELGLGTSPTLIRRVVGVVALRVDIFSPNTSPVEAGTVTFTGKVLGPDTITDLEYQVDDGAFTSFIVAEDWSVDIDIELATTSVTIRATDDQLETDTATFNFTAQDTTAPVVGDSGTLSSESTDDIITVSFTKATDNAYPQSELVYELYSGEESELSDLETIKEQSLEDSDTDVSELVISNVSQGALYFYNVLVRDPSGNEAIYEVANEITLDPEVDSFEVEANGEDVTGGIELSLGEAVQLDITVIVNDSDNEDYSTSIVNTDVATIDANDVVTGETVGTTTLIITADLDDTQIEIPIEVIEDELSNDSEIVGITTA